MAPSHLGADYFGVQSPSPAWEAVQHSQVQHPAAFQLLTPSLSPEPLAEYSCGTEVGQPPSSLGSHANII